MIINDFSNLRGLAILSIFFVHSNLYLSINPIITLIQIWFIGILFFVSGYLTCNSFRKRGLKIGKFLIHRLAAIYIPFVLIMAFYVMNDIYGNYPVSGFVTHASLLSFFAIFQEGTFCMGLFWFVPTLFGFTVIMIFLDKYLKNNGLQLIILFGLLIFNFVNYFFYTPLRFNLNFGTYIFLFATGYFICKNNWIEKAKKLPTTIISFSIFVFILAVLYTYFFGVLYPLSVFVVNWIYYPIFVLSTIPVLLTLSNYFQNKWPSSKALVFLSILSSCSLYIYLLEGFISERIGWFLFDEFNYYQHSGNVLFISIFVRFLIVTFVAFYALKFQKFVTLKAKNRFDLKITLG